MSGQKILEGLNDAIAGSMGMVVVMTEEQLRDRVHESLDNAACNEHWAWIMSSDPKEVADDMLAYDADVEGFDADALVPHIKTWQAKHQEATRGA